MISFNIDAVNSLISPINISDLQTRMVASFVDPDHNVAILIGNKSGSNWKLFTKNSTSQNKIEPTSVFDAFIGTDVKIDAFLSSKEGPYCIVFSNNQGVYYTKIKIDGSVSISPTLLFRPNSNVKNNIAVSILSDSFIVFERTSESKSLKILARKYLQNAPVQQDPVVAYQHDFLSGNSLDLFSIHSLSYPSSVNVLFVICMYSEVMGEDKNRIVGVTFDANNMHAIGSRDLDYFYQPASNRDQIIISSFDDIIVSDGLWLIVRGSTSDQPSETNRTMFLIQPSLEFSDSTKTGYRNSFDPVTVDDSNGLLKSPELFSTEDVCFFGQNTLEFVNRELLIVKKTPSEMIQSASVPIDVRNGYTLVDCEGKAATFHSLSVKNGENASLLKVISNDIPEPLPPEQIFPTFKTDLIGSIYELSDACKIHGFAQNEYGDIAILYSVDTKSINVISLMKNGEVSQSIQIDKSFNENSIDTAHHHSGIIAADNNEFIITYTKIVNEYRGTYVARVKPNCTGFSDQLPNVITVIDPSNRWVYDHINTLVFKDLSFVCTFEYAENESDFRDVRLVKYNASGQFVRNIILGPTGSKTVRSFTRSKQLYGNFLVTICAKNVEGEPLEKSTQTWIYSVDENLLNHSARTLVAFSHDANITKDFFGVDDGIAQDGLWIQCLSEESYVSCMYTSGPVLQIAPNSEKFISTQAVFDRQGNIFGLDVHNILSKQDRNTCLLYPLALNSEFSPVSYVGDVNAFTVRVNTENLKIIALSWIYGNPVDVFSTERSDVPSQQASFTEEISEVYPSDGDVTSSDIRTGYIEMPSIAVNQYGDVAVLRFDPVDSSGNFQRKGRLYVDVYDLSFVLQSSSSPIVWEMDDPIITRNDDSVLSYRNSTPHVTALKDSGNFIVYWGSLTSLEGDAQFWYTIVDCKTGEWSERKHLTPKSCWNARITVLPDDRFIASYIEWVPNDFSSKVCMQLFNSYGPEKVTEIFYGENLKFQKNIVAGEYAHDLIMIAFTSAEKQCCVATADVSKLDECKYKLLGDEFITGFGDEDESSLWIDNGSKTKLISPHKKDVFVIQKILDSQLPTVFRRAVFDADGNVYGIRSKTIPPSILRLEKTSQFLGDLTFNGESKISGYTQLDTPIAGTGERMLVPVYRDEYKNSYDIVILVQNMYPGYEAPNADIVPIITTDYLPDGYVDEEYDFSIDSFGYLEFTAEGLPHGLRISSEGTIYGVPTTRKEYIVTISAINEAGMISKIFKLNVKNTSTMAGFDHVRKHPGEFLGFVPLGYVRYDGTSINVVSNSKNHFIWSVETLYDSETNEKYLSVQKHSDEGLPIGNSILIRQIGYDLFEYDIDQDRHANPVIVWVAQDSRTKTYSVWAARYDHEYNMIYPPRIVSDVQKNILCTIPRVFTFSDGCSSIIWHEGSDLKLSIISPEGNLIAIKKHKDHHRHFHHPMTVSSYTDSSMAASISGDRDGTVFDVVFSDGRSFGINRYDNRGCLISSVTKEPSKNEVITAISSSYSEFDKFLTIALSVRNGISYSVVLRRYNEKGETVSKLYTAPSQRMAQFGKTTKGILQELCDGSFALTYYSKSSNEAFLWRFDRDVNVIGRGISESDILDYNKLFLSCVNNNIIWGFCQNDNVVVYRLIQNNESLNRTI